MGTPVFLSGNSCLSLEMKLVGNKCFFGTFRSCRDAKQMVSQPTNLDFFKLPEKSTYKRVIHLYLWNLVSMKGM